MIRAIFPRSTKKVPNRFWIRAKKPIFPSKERKGMIDMKTYGEILALCEAGSVTSVPQPVALAHPDYYGIVMGHGWQDAIASAPSFEARFPSGNEAGAELLQAFGGRRFYRIWREGMLRLIAVAGGSASSNVFRTLRSLGLADGLKGLTDLRSPLSQAFGDQIHPWEITALMALAADEGVGGLDWRRLRKAFSDLDRLRALKSVQECGILGSKPIGPMPRLGGNGRQTDAACNHEGICCKAGYSWAQQGRKCL